MHVAAEVEQGVVRQHHVEQHVHGGDQEQHLQQRAEDGELRADDVGGGRDGAVEDGPVRDTFDALVVQRVEGRKSIDRVRGINVAGLDGGCGRAARRLVGKPDPGWAALLITWTAYTSSPRWAEVGR